MAAWVAVIWSVVGPLCLSLSLFLSRSVCPCLSVCLSVCMYVCILCLHVFSAKLPCQKDCGKLLEKGLHLSAAPSPAARCTWTGLHGQKIGLCRLQPGGPSFRATCSSLEARALGALGIARKDFRESCNHGSRKVSLLPVRTTRPQPVSQLQSNNEPSQFCPKPSRFDSSTLGMRRRARRG